jgi:hypothetical protein
MRGEANPRPNMFSYIALESRIPNSHPIRKIRRIVDTALEDLESTFDEMYDNQGVHQSHQISCCEPSSCRYYSLSVQNAS